MVELIKITEGIYAYGVASSVYAKLDIGSNSFIPDPVFSKIEKLLLSTQICDIRWIAHYVSGEMLRYRLYAAGPSGHGSPTTANQKLENS